MVKNKKKANKNPAEKKQDKKNTANNKPNTPNAKKVVVTFPEVERIQYEIKLTRLQFHPDKIIIPFKPEDNPFFETVLGFVPNSKNWDKNVQIGFNSSNIYNGRFLYDIKLNSITLRLAPDAIKKIQRYVSDSVFLTIRGYDAEYMNKVLKLSVTEKSSSGSAKSKPNTQPQITQCPITPKKGSILFSKKWLIGFENIPELLKDSSSIDGTLKFRVDETAVAFIRKHLSSPEKSSFFVKIYNMNFNASISDDGIKRVITCEASKEVAKSFLIFLNEKKTYIELSKIPDVLDYFVLKMKTSIPPVMKTIKPIRKSKSPVRKKPAPVKTKPLSMSQEEIDRRVAATAKRRAEEAERKRLAEDAWKKEEEEQKIFSYNPNRRRSKRRYARRNYRGPGSDNVKPRSEIVIKSSTRPTASYIDRPKDMEDLSKYSW